MPGSNTGFGVRPDQRTTLLIDGPSLHATARAIGFDVDYKKLLSHFDDRGTLHRAIYFTALNENDEFTPLRPLVDWLGYNGYMLVTKPFKDFTDATGRRRMKGSIHAEMSVEMLEASQFADHLILFSGDAELTYAVRAVQRRGCRVTAVSTLKEGMETISADLRRVVDRFVDLVDVRDLIFKSGREIPGREIPATAEAPSGNATGRPTNGSVMSSRQAPPPPPPPAPAGAAIVLEARRPILGLGGVRRVM